VHHQDALLLARLDWHEPHVGSADRLADRLGVSRVGLVALDVGLHVLRRDQTYFVTKTDKLPRPVMSARTRLHAHQAVGLFCEEGEEFAASQFAPKHSVPGCINAVNLEDRLCEIEANRDNGHDGALLGRWLRLKFARSGIDRGGPCHQMGRSAQTLYDAGNLGRIER
jgi:hypothetical protein